MGWTAGDRVALTLRDKHRDPFAGEREAVEVTGTVVEVDPPRVGSPGVAALLDRYINGVNTCYATHEELRPL